MDNILYLDDYINIYNKKLNKIIKIKPYKKTLENGLIIDKVKFIKIFNNFKVKNNLHKNFFNENITIITNGNYRNNDKYLLKEVLEELNYKNITFINELELFKIDKKTLIISFNYDYFYMYYVDILGKVKVCNYENNIINNSLIKDIIKLINKEKIIIIGKNTLELVNILDKTTYNFYYYEEYDNLFIKMFIKDKSVQFM